MKSCSHFAFAIIPRAATTVLITLSLLALSGCAYRWQSAGLGAEPVSGSFAWKDNAVEVTGTGTGLNPKGGDSMQFVFVTSPGGDFEIVGRLRSLTGGAKPSAGILARESAAGRDAMIALLYQTEPLGAGWRSRFPGEGVDGAPVWQQNGTRLSAGAPLWLKLVRVGDNFGAYKSDDGRFWSMLGNVSGGGAPFAGGLELGFFVAGGSETETATAVFDNIRIGKPKLRYRTSWVGNTFGSRDEEKHVSNGLSAMWVASDGTVYTSTYWDEGGRPVTSYTSDGKCGRALSGTPQSAEGGITGDDRYVYFAHVDKVMRHDRQNPDTAAKPLEIATSLHDRQARRSVVSGLAANGKELFVADSRDNLIRVVSLRKVPMRWRPFAANARVQLPPEPVTVPGGDARLAPALVYQTQRAGESILYAFDGMEAGKTYTVRLHLAEFEDRGKLPPDHRDRILSIEGKRINVAEAAGGVRVGHVYELQRQADAKGQVTVGYGSYGPGVCGVEVLDASSKRLFAVNCGGPPVDGFEGESQELSDRAFAVERPGPMIFDQRGDLWIIQRGNDFPIGGLPRAKYPAAVRCYRPDGAFTGREIADVVNPRGLGYDAANDRLLVAENGPDLNVRFYGSLDAQPVLVKTFGAPGGIYAGRHPGRVYDPEAGGHARFQGVAGVGVDARGNLYVGGGFSGTDLRKFRPDGKLEWMLNSLIFCNTYDVDPDSYGADIYATYNHLKLDLSKTAPGSEQTFFGYNWDLRRFGAPERVGNSQSIVRRLGPNRDLFMFTTGQGDIQDVNIYRKDGELWIPCGSIRERGKRLWIDANGDGIETDGESTPLEGRLNWITGVDVDDCGDIRVVVSVAGRGSHLGHLAFLGLNEHGVPLYNGAEGQGLEVLRAPEEGGTVNAWGMALRLAYSRERDLMVLRYPAEARTKDEKGEYPPPRYFLAAYDRWSKGNRTPLWKQLEPTPGTHPRWFMFEAEPGPYNLFTGIMGMQIAGDYLFAADLWGQVFAFDLATGNLVELFAVGPEMGGRSAWEDAAMGLRAFRRKNGEYLIFTENSGWGGKNNFFRWKP